MEQKFPPPPYFSEIKIQEELPAGRVGGQISLDTDYSLSRDH